MGNNHLVLLHIKPLLWKRTAQGSYTPNSELVKPALMRRLTASPDGWKVLKMRQVPAQEDGLNSTCCSSSTAEVFLFGSD